MAESSITPSFGEVIIDVDVDGDLFLRVGSDHGGSEYCLFRVCSSTLRRSSLVWRKMLFGSWAEAKPAQGQWAICLPDDQPMALSIILGIIHARFEFLSTELSLAQLDELVILVDKYDLAHVIGPWAETWMSRVQNNVEYTALAYLRRTHVAWELGNEDWFATEVRDTVFRTSADKGGQLVYHYGVTSVPLACREHFGPLDLIEVISPSRLALIQEILDFFHKQISIRTGDSSACDCAQAAGPTGTKKKKSLKYYESDQIRSREECDIFIIGGIYRGLLRLFDGNLSKNASDISESADQLLGVIANLLKQVDSFKDHDSCSPASQFTKFEINTRKDQRWTNLLRSGHKEWMATRRKTLELSGTANGKTRNMSEWFA